MSFYHLKNHGSIQTATGVDPWDYKPSGTVPYELSKEEFRRWCGQPTTSHFFFSAYEGLNPHIRVSEDNPAEKLHGLVADFDAEVLPDDWASIMARAPADFPPSHGSLTQSGNLRLVWEFEAPIWVYEKNAHKALLERMMKELRMSKLAAGFEKEAFLDVSKMYEVGTQWRKLSDKKIPTTTLQFWLWKAAEKAQYKSGEDVAVPIEKVAAEVEKRFPGRWKGDFVLGARGCRFWDPAADCDTASVVHEMGLQNFTGDVKFSSWRAIFGGRFVEEYAENRIAQAVQDVYFDGREYWSKYGEGDRAYYERCSKDSMVLHLKVACGLEPSRKFGQQGSEIEQALYYVERNNRVARAVPFVHRRPGPLMADDQRCLNIARCRPIKAVEEPQEWGENFPFLADFFGGFFVTEEDAKNPLDFFFAWLRHAYMGAVEFKPRHGQAVFLAGPVGRGKTFVSTQIIGPLLGGSMDCTSILQGETSFNGPAYFVPLWRVDDAGPGKDPRDHAKFSTNVKKMAANRNFEFMAKFRDQSSVDWAGRVVVTLNDDAESLRMLPEAEMSILDKVMFYRISEREFVFPLNSNDKVAEELPFFARWLMDWEPPEATIGTNRYGVADFHEPWMLDEARRLGRSCDFRELLDIFRASYFERETSNEWTGSASELLVIMSQDILISDLLKMQRLTPAQAGREMRKLAAMSYTITERTVRGKHQWTIHKVDNFSPKEESSAGDAKK